MTKDKMGCQEQNIRIAFYTFISFPVVLLLLQISSTFLSAPTFAVKGPGGPEELNNTMTAPATSKQYIENARHLLEQVSVEYKKGNHTGAEELATSAYLNNFEYVETDLMKHNAKALSDQIEQMMRVELRDKIKNNVPLEQIDIQIKAINIKFDEALTKISI